MTEKQSLRPEELTQLLHAWQHPQLTLAVVRQDEAELAAELILRTSSELRTHTAAGAEQTRERCRAAQRDGDLFLLLRHAEVMVGVLRADLYAAGEGQRLLYVAQLNLVPEYRSRGLGSALLQMLDEWRSKLDVGTLALDFMADNGRVAAFYRRLGFEVAGYDLLQRHAAGAAALVATPRPSSNALRAYHESDLGRVVDHLRDKQGFICFEQPCMSVAALAVRVQACAEDRDARLWLVEREGQLLGVCAAYLKLGASGRRLLVATCFEGADLEVAGLLFGALAERARELGVAESYVTLWEPCASLLQLAQRAGYGVGRYKMCKRIPQ